MIRLRPFLAVLLSLLLLGAQQGAFAHMIGHLGAGADAAAPVADHGDKDHGKALSLSHVCTTCVSLAGLAGAAPPPVPPGLAGPAPVAPLPGQAPGPRRSVVCAPYSARSPRRSLKPGRSRRLPVRGAPIVIRFGESPCINP
jgi:hypothetical protein